MSQTSASDDRAKEPGALGSVGPVALPDVLCFAVYAANHAFGRAYKPLLDRLGLTYPQYLVMVILWEGEGPTVGAIGRRLFLESNTLTPLLKRLEAQGLVSRARDSGDERQVVVRPTERGLALRKEARSVPGCIEQATGLDGPGLACLRDELGRLRERLDRLGG